MPMLAADVPPAYAFSARPLTTVQRHRLYGSSWHPGCPVGLDDLRYARLSYYGFDGRRHTGRLVVNADAVAAVKTAFDRRPPSETRVPRTACQNDEGRPRRDALRGVGARPARSDGVCRRGAT
ncbi:hypothetical protein DSM104299_04896 [Baekduia alba]|nr:hypothetical protein DSM104299_04896 [Baekduia alba]